MIPNRLLAVAAAAVAAPALAHEGHGLPGAAHWHAADAAGWIALAVLVVGAVMWLRRK
jgi:hypothetical protein